MGLSEEHKLEYRPDMAPHVVGRYEPRKWDAEANGWEEQRIEMACEHPGCNARFVRTCSSGRVREHVQRFALGHLHRDPFASRQRPA